MPFWLWPAIGMVLGAVIGSYIATIVVRWPRGQAARGRSRCDGCGAVLRARDLVPVLSFIAQRGRCRVCGAAIDRRHPAIEIIAVAIGGVALSVAPGPVGIGGALFGWVLLAMAALDLGFLWLPDRLTGALALSGLAAGIAGLPPSLADRLTGGVAGFLVLAGIALAYRKLRGREGMGGGDPKLLGGIGLWLGWQALPFVLLAASLIGIAGIIALRFAGRRSAATARVPFGTLLAVAAWLLWLAGRASLLPPGL